MNCAEIFVGGLMAEISDAIELFLAMKTPNTKRAYRLAIDEYERVVGAVGMATPADAMRYFVRVKNTKSGATLALKFAAISAIYNYLIDMGLLQKNPLRAVKRSISWRQSAQVRPTAILPVGAVRKIMRLSFEGTKNEIRNKAFLALLFGSGLRRSEAHELTLEQIKVSPGKLLYIELTKTKAGKRQVRSIAKFAVKYIRKLITQRNCEGAKNTDPLFVFYRVDGGIRGRVDIKTLYRIFKSASARAGYRAAPHAARVTYATRLHDLTKSLLLVSRALGHSNTQQAEKYIRDRERLEDNPAILLDYK